MCLFSRQVGIQQTDKNPCPHGTNILGEGDSQKQIKMYNLSDDVSAREKINQEGR